MVGGASLAPDFRYEGTARPRRPFTPVEKLFRGARVTLVEDGTTEVLGLEVAVAVVDDYELD